MVLENEKVRSEKLYCVGYLKTLGKYILSQTVPASAWYNRYYEITKEQYDSQAEFYRIIDALKNKGAEAVELALQ